MKFKLLAGAALAAVFAASGASAQEGWYGAIDLGANVIVLHRIKFLIATESVIGQRWPIRTSDRLQSMSCVRCPFGGMASEE